MKRSILIFCIMLFPLMKLSAQELMCQVSVNSQQIQGSDRHIYDNMQTAIREFMNTRKWTSYTYKIEEKIDCSIMINLSERVSDEEFKGTMTVQARRPIYGTSYNSVMLNMIDKDIQFKYIETTPLDFDENSHLSNLTSILAYYAYMIIGIDFDSYTLYGGAIYFNKAQNIVNNAQTAAEKGWKSFETKKNRYWMVENLLNKSNSSLRDCEYYYHLKGLDQMKDNIQTGRAGVTRAIEGLQKAYREQPNLYFAQLFLDSKRDEICNIYSQASPAEKTKVVAMLKEIDPSHSGDYNNKITNAGPK
jgi:hypothetical protein